MLTCRLLPVEKTLITDVRTPRRLLWLAAGLTLTLASVGLSLWLGSNSLPADRVWLALTGAGEQTATTIVWEQRVPRTLLALLCGAALAVAGSLMQALTRNPLAEPGLLGVNAGASVAVVLAVILWGTLSPSGYALAALAGAAVTCGAVFALGKGSGGSLVKLALAGVAVSAALSAVNQGLILSNADAYNEFRFWAAGSLEARSWEVLLPLLPTVLVAFALTLLVCPALHALATGEEAAISLGISVRRTRSLTLLAVILLAGGATAAIGPISFVGLAVPFIARALLGNDVRWVTAGSLILGPAWLLAADVLARLILAPAETQVGIIATLAGAPLFIALMSRRKVVAL